MFDSNDFFDLFNSMERTLFGNTEIIRKNSSPNEFLKVYLGLTTPLSPRSINVLIYIIKNVNSEGIYEGNYEDLMSKFAISRATLAGIMAELQEIGLILKVKNGWKVSDDVKMRSNGNSLIVKFDNLNNKNDKDKYLDNNYNKLENVDKVNNLKDNFTNKEAQIIGRSNRVIPEFNFEKFKVFAGAYYESYLRIMKNDEISLQAESLKKYGLSLKDSYVRDNKNLDFVSYVEAENADNTEEKAFLLKALRLYLQKYDKIDCDNFEPDFEDCDFNLTKQRYLNVIENNKDLSQDTKFLMKNMMLHMLNIAKVFGFYDFSTIYHLINNDFDRGRKILMEAELIARNGGSIPGNFAVSLNAYRSYIDKQNHIFDCLSALSNMALDNCQIIKYL